ncbi:hypothetical protein HanXRQr2_Chr17g0796791 [Helianthus annuus]|uniref:Uncharacterized protein n=1 Tax=Helianthus annuus TaxID=4232 RepID=A0A251RNH5_HELAN|nr:hypothetical protein HanXRQr2_Chr17g0796791 [Helianthus annuus]KAJ0812670.1 hypothetical protein HanPSC8_Chr17g0764551 [Helianthus annuus]
MCQDNIQQTPRPVDVVVKEEQETIDNCFHSTLDDEEWCLENLNAIIEVCKPYD